MGSLLAQFDLENSDERNQDLGLYLDLLNQGNVHRSPLFVLR